jgi:hypothetical protein
MACFWHMPPSKEGHAMSHGQEDAWWGVLFAAFMVGLLLGSLLVVRLTENLTASSAPRARPGTGRPDARLTSTAP